MATGTTYFQSQDGSDLKIADVTIIVPGSFDGSLPPKPNPNKTIKKGEKFTIVVRLEFTELLGDVGAKSDLRVIFHDIIAGGSQAAYYKAKMVELPADSTRLNVEFENVEAIVAGIFMVYVAATVPASDIAAYSEGPVLFVFPIP